MVKPVMDKQRLNDQSLKIVNAALHQLGGIGDLVARRKTDILPALVQSACVLVLSEEEHRSVDEIAELLDMPVGTVRSVLEAPLEGYKERIRYEVDEMEEFDPHTDPEWTGLPTTAHLEKQYLAGALAKSAYVIVRREQGTIKTWP